MSDSLGFISVKVVQTQQQMLTDVALDAGVIPLNYGDYHCTVCYDVQNQEWREHIPQLPYKTFEAKVIDVEEMGEWKDGVISAVALVLDSPDLVEEHELFLNVGHTHTYDDFIPHCSIAYKLTEEEAERVKMIARRLIGKVLYFSRESIELIQD